MTLNLSTEQIIKILNLIPHVEGGYGGICYQDEGIIPSQVLPKYYKGDRTFGNAIFFLLPKGEKSILHRINMNEMWHFYFGDPLELYTISSEGKVIKVILGQNLLEGQKLVHVVPRLHWCGAIPTGPNYSLVGCSTAPGFEQEDWEKGDRIKLLNKFPHAQEIIEKLT